MTGNLNIISSADYDSPRITFINSYGSVFLDRYYNDFRIADDQNGEMFNFNRDAIKSNDGTDTINLVYSRKIFSYEYWSNYPIGIASFFYEGADTTTYNLPYPNVIVTVFKASSARGIAIAYKWNTPTLGDDVGWINFLHDTWQGWQVMAKI